MLWDWVVKLRCDHEVKFEICFEEHCIELSCHDILKRMWKKHDAMWTDIICMCDNMDTEHK